MSAAAQYRRNASECVAITAFFIDPQQRAAVLALAEAWNRLAAQAEKNEQAVLSTTDAPARSSGQARSIP
jgi:phytoene/squalene synthetase